VKKKLFGSPMFGLGAIVGLAGLVIPAFVVVGVIAEPTAAHAAICMGAVAGAWLFLKKLRSDSRETRFEVRPAIGDQRAFGSRVPEMVGKRSLMTVLSLTALVLAAGYVLHRIDRERALNDLIQAEKMRIRLTLANAARMEQVTLSVPAPELGSSQMRTDYNDQIRSRIGSVRADALRAQSLLLQAANTSEYQKKLAIVENAEDVSERASNASVALSQAIVRYSESSSSVKTAPNRMELAVSASK
jgi:hypothetical protein